MVEEGRQCDALAQNITCHKVDGECACALSGLSVGRLDSSYKRLVVAPRKIKIEGEIVGDTALLASDLEDLVEVGNLVSCSESQLLRQCLDKLASRRIEAERPGVTVFGIELDIIEQCELHSDQRREFFSDCHRRDIEWRCWNVLIFLVMVIKA